MAGRGADGAHRDAGRAGRRLQRHSVAKVTIMNVEAGFTVGERAGYVIKVEAGKVHEAADAGNAALIRAGCHIYQRGGQLVRPAMIAARASDGAKIETPGIVAATPPMLQRELGRVARWEKAGRKGGRVRCNPSADAIAQILAMAGEWPFPVLAATISTPTMRRDGSLLTAEGFDTATGLMLLGPPAMPPIPDWPSKEDARRALVLLAELLRDFPFVSDGARAVALSMLLTPVLRVACCAAVPMHVATAPEAGTGKSYLADVAAAIATGARCPVVAQSRDPEELEKRLGGLLIEGAPIICIDNVNGILGGDFLCQMIERPSIRVRPLGTSQSLLIPNTVCVFANGNNLRVAGDLVRRVLVAELDADAEAPETRTFSGDPVAAVLADRGCYVAAVLTIARAYVVAGRPDRLSPMPSFG